MIAIIKKSQITASRLLLLAISALFFGAVYPVAAQDPVTVNAGTRLMIRTETVLNTGKIKKGERFTGVLEGKLMSGDVTIVRQARKFMAKLWQ